MLRKMFDGFIKRFIFLLIFLGSLMIPITNAYATGGFGSGWGRELAWVGFLFITAIQIIVSLLYYKFRGLFPFFLVCCLFYSFIFGWFCYGIILQLSETNNKGIIGFGTFFLFYYLFLLVLVSFKWSQDHEIKTAIHRTLTTIFIVLFSTWLLSPRMPNAWAGSDGDQYWLIPAGSGLWGPFNVNLNVLNPVTTSLLAILISIVIFVINKFLYQATAWITLVYRVAAQIVLCVVLIIGLKVIFEPPLLGIVSKCFVDPKQILTTNESYKFNECVRWSEYYGIHITEHDVAKYRGYPGGFDTFAVSYLRRAQINMKSNNYEKALNDYTNSIRLIPHEHENNLGYVNNYVESAWLYATFHDEKIRNGNRAIELANKAIDASGLDLKYRTVDQLMNDTSNCHQSWTSDLAFPAMLLEVLAAAYAQANDFEHAIKTQEKSLSLMTLGRPENVDEQNLLKEQLETYKANKPWRQYSNSLIHMYFGGDTCGRLKRMQEKRKGV